MMRRLLILFLVLIAAPVMAASAPPTASSQPLGVNVDQGISLTLSMPASSVFIANPEIADVQVMSPTSIMVFGKRTGQTTSWRPIIWAAHSRRVPLS